MRPLLARMVKQWNTRSLAVRNASPSPATAGLPLWANSTNCAQDADESMEGTQTNWQTPTVTDAGGHAYTYPNGNHEAPFATLTGQAQQGQWSTPAARDWKNGQASAETMERNARPLNEQVQHHFRPVPMTPPAGAVTSRSTPSARPPSRALNPTFVEALMSWPLGWTKMCDCRGACCCRRIDRLRMLGNGVVVEQGAAALRLLAERILFPRIP